MTPADLVRERTGWVDWLLHVFREGYGIVTEPPVKKVIKELPGPAA